MPMASTTMAASMMPIEGMFSSAVRPLNSGLSSSAQESIGRPIRSGRMPSVWALYTVGISDMYCVGAAAKFPGLLAFQIDHLLGGRALLADGLARHHAGGKQRGDLAGVFDAQAVDAPEIAGTNHFPDREALGAH